MKKVMNTMRKKLNKLKTEREDILMTAYGRVRRGVVGADNLGSVATLP